MGKKNKRNKRVVLVTGVAGFIGSNYINYTARKYPNYFFVGVDSLTGIADISNIEVQNRKNFIFIRCDIRDRIELQKIFHGHRPTDVVHFAAETHVDYSIKNPIVFSETNVNGTHNILYISRNYGVNRFLHISTDEVYGTLGYEDPPFTENSPYAPNSPYSASKAAAELFVRSYEKTFGMNVIITRCSNNYGPKQDHTKFIPLFINKLLNKEKAPLYGTGENVRDWIFVEDHVKALDLIFHKAKPGSIYNIGGNNELKNTDVVEHIIKGTGGNRRLIKLVPDRPGHDLRYSLNTKKIEDELGFKPKTTFDVGIKKTINFYKKNKIRSEPYRKRGNGLGSKKTRRG